MPNFWKSSKFLFHYFPKQLRARSFSILNWMQIFVNAYRKISIQSPGSLNITLGSDMPLTLLHLMLMSKIYVVNSDMKNVIGMSDPNVMFKGPGSRSKICLKIILIEALLFVTRNFLSSENPLWVIFSYQTRFSSQSHCLNS